MKKQQADLTSFRAIVNQIRRLGSMLPYNGVFSLPAIDSCSTDGTGAFTQAISLLHKRIAIDYLVEEMYRLLIACCAAAGDRSGALRQFEHCTVVLERK